MAVMLVVVGVHIILTPDVVAISHMRTILEVMSAESLGFLCFAAGVVRVGTLAFRPSHIALRMLSAFVAILLLGEMVIDFAWRVVKDGALLPPGWFMLGAQWAAEVWLFLDLSKR